MLNKVSLQGRLVATPELKTSSSGISVTTFTLAVGRKYVKKGEDRQTDYIDIVAWRNTAEFICRNFVKGQMVLVSGSIQTRSFTDREGKMRKVCEVIADEVYFTEKKDREPEPSQDDDWLFD